MPTLSPSAVLTAGAVCTITVLAGSAMARIILGVWSCALARLSGTPPRIVPKNVQGESRATAGRPAPQRRGIRVYSMQCPHGSAPCCYRLAAAAHDTFVHVALRAGEWSGL